MDFLPPAVVRLVADVKDFQAGIGQAERRLEGMSAGGVKSFAAIGAAAGLAGAAVAGFAMKLAKDAVQAAIEDEKSMRLLNQTLINTGHAGSLPGVEVGISKMMMQTGVADEQLRPALQRLILATGDVSKSQEALQLALDISAGTGRDLNQVVMALSRGYSGSTTALSRLGAGLDQATLKSKDMDLITAALAKKFAGDAAVAADTYEGRMRRLSTAASEASEKVGYELLAAIDNIASSMGGEGGAIDAITSLGDEIANTVQGVSDVIQPFADLSAGVREATGGWLDLGTALNYAFNMWAPLADIGERSNEQQKVQAERIAASESYWTQYIRTLGAAAGSTQDLAEQEQELADRTKEVKAAFRELDNSLSARGAMLNFKEGLRGLSEELDKTSKKLSGYSEGAVINQQAVIDILQDAEQAAQKWGDKVGATPEQVTAKFQQMTTDIRTSLIQQGFKQADIDAFFGSVGVWSAGGQAASANARQAGMRAGRALGEGVTAGITASEASAATAAGDLMDAATRAARRRALIESPSKVWYEMGSQLVEGLSNALDEKKGRAVERAQAMMDNLNERFAAAKDMYQQTFDTLFDGLDVSHAMEQAEATGSTIAYQFIAQADEAQKFGVRLQQLIAAGLNESTWQQIAGMSAQRGIQVADAYLNGNTAQMIADTNRAVDAAKAVADTTSKQAAGAFRAAGISSAIETLEGIISELMPAGKTRKRLMRMMDELAEAMKRTTTVTVITHNVSSGGGGGGAPATIAELPPVSGSELGQYAPQGLGGPINIPSGEGRIFAEMAAASEAGRIREYAAGGWVAGMGAKPAVVHGGEYVLSGDMLAGRQPVDSEVMRALAKGGQSIQVTAQTNADPYAISREIAWAMKVGVA